MAKGIDYTAPVNLDKAKSIKAAGYDFVCRYLVPEQYAWKRLTPEEMKALSGAGLNIVSVFETSANRASGGKAAGGPDGQSALAEAKRIGQPPGSAIYFAVDYDAQPTGFDAIERYLRAAAAELPEYSVGVYGSYAVVGEMLRRGAVTHAWQTYAWSGGKWSKGANIHQYQNGATVCGMQVDLNESYGGEGWWSLTPAGPFPDVAADRWSAGAIAAVKAAGVMNGYPDGTFRPVQPVTREELATALAAALKEVN